MNVYILVVDDEPDVEALFRQQFRRELRYQLRDRRPPLIDAHPQLVQLFTCLLGNDHVLVILTRHIDLVHLKAELICVQVCLGDARPLALRPPRTEVHNHLVGGRCAL